MPESITGTVSRVYFTSPTFSAGVLDSDDGLAVKYSGKFHSAVGDTLNLTGCWTTHPKFGRQFSATGLSYDLPDTAEGLIRYLAKSPVFKGIGEAIATRLVSYAQSAERLDELIRNHLDELHTALRIPEATLQSLRAGWIAHAAENKVRSYLSAFELTPCQMDTLLERFGEAVVGILRDDPYVLIRHVPGYGFKRVDEIARKMGVAKSHPGRIRAGLLHTVSDEINDGHTWIDGNDLLRKANDLLLLDELDSLERIKNAGKELAQSGELACEGAAVTLPKIREDERVIFDTLKSYGHTVGFGLTPTPSHTEGLLPGQKHALELALLQRISVITGSAGTGKSLTISRIVRAFHEQGKSIAVCAPTGKAAKRAEELLRQYGLSQETMTIHRMLGYTGATYSSERIDADVVIIDEVSMVSVDLMAELLRHLDLSRTVLILVGDHNQLPSVGPGSVLRDIIAHHLAPVACLTEVVRQAGVLKANSTAVLAGELAPTDQTKREWLLIDQFKEPSEIQNYLRDLIRIHIPQRLGFDPLSEVQIISPTHRGLLGTKEINRMLQYLHHGPVEGRFTIGDRVVQKANDYNLEIFNGSLGTVRAMDKEGILVDFDLEGERLIPTDKSAALQLAYCLTIHSMQGSEAPCVVLLLHKSHWHACRQLVYTGVTRARKALILLGDRWGIRQAVKNQRASQRRTLLPLWASK